LGLLQNLNKADKDRKHGQKINHTNALATIMDILAPTFARNKYKEGLFVFNLIVELQTIMRIR
jgi:hypothetical protein